MVLQEEGEGTDGDKKDIKKPSGAPLFDDEMVDSKADVKEKAEELRKQGCKFSFFLTTSFDSMINLFDLFIEICRWSHECK